MTIDEALVLLDPDTLDAEHAEHQDVVDAGRLLAAEVRALREELDVTHAQYERLGDSWEKQGDELTALRQRLADYESHGPEGHNVTNLQYQQTVDELDALRQRHAEAEKALAQLREWKDAACQTMRDYVRNAERQAEAVEAAFREGLVRGQAYSNGPEWGIDEESAWQHSNAKKQLT